MTEKLKETQGIAAMLWFFFGVVILSGLHGEEDMPQLEVLVLVGEASSSQSEPYSKTTFELDEDQIQNWNLQDILERQASVQVRKAGGRAAYSTLSIRGSSSSQVKVFVDGQELGSGDRQSVDLSTLPLDRFERIEIYRSHAPARFGVGAMGGVVHLITRKGAETDTGSIRIGAGSFGYGEGRLDWSPRSKKVNHRFHLHYQREEGDFDYTDDNLTPDITSDDVERTRINNDFEFWDFGWSGKKEIVDGGFATWSLSYFDRDKGLAGSAKFQSPGVRYLEEHLNFESAYRQQGIFLKESEFEAQLSYRNLKDEYLDRGSNLGLGVQDNVYDFESYGLSFLHHHYGGVYPWTLRLSQRLEEQQIEERATNLIQPTRKRSQTDVGFDLEMLMLEERLELRPSLAMTWVRDDFTTSKSLHDEGTVSLSGLFSAHRYVSVRAGVSRGVRIPGFSEMFGDRGVMVGNASLVPESSEDMDLALLLELDQGTRSLTMEIGFFRSVRENLIAIIYDSRGVGQAQNLGRGKIEGFEWSSSFELGRGLSGGHHFTLQDPIQEQVNIFGGQGKKIPGIYETSFSSWLQWKASGWTFRYEFLFEAEKAYDSANLITAADKELHRLGIRFKSGQWNLALDIDNLTDETIEDYNNWPRPGRTFTFSSQLSF